ncbi:MAG: hypothetical protein K8I02_06630, partial [Candidatus Methylomirabilis sp.]|nr:hypothetical protein [Deltaproteobacteria bacterium]
VEEGFPPEAIDAGFPWAGYHAYLPSHRAPEARGATPRDRWYVQEYAWAMEVKRVLAFSLDDPARYEVIREIPLGALFGRPRTLYVLGYR